MNLSVISVEIEHAEIFKEDILMFISDREQISLFLRDLLYIESQKKVQFINSKAMTYQISTTMRQLKENSNRKVLSSAAMGF